VDLDARLPAYLAARLVGVTKQTFNYWRATGKVTPDEAGTYRLGDVLEVERATRRSPNSRRKPIRPVARCGVVQASVP
jgi:hypothetical protein